MEQKQVSETGQARGPYGHEGAVMTFAEIGREMGITPAHAFWLYKSGMNKLRRNSKTMAGLHAMARELDLARVGR